MWIRLGLCAAAALMLSASAAAGQASPAPPGNDDCLTCHADGDAKRSDGRSIAVDAARFGASIHGPLGCVDCHADAAKELPHADTLAKVACGRCHEEIAGKYHDS